MSIIINPYVLATGGGGGGAMPTFVAAGAFSASAPGISIGLPAGWQQNDILLAFVESSGNPFSTVSLAGYSAAPGAPVQGPVGGSTQLSAFWKRAGSSESAPTTSEVGSGNHHCGQMIAIRGCPAVGSPFDVTASGGNGGPATSGSCAGATTTVANTLVIVAVATHADENGAQFSGWANASLANIIERLDNSSGANDGGGLGLITGEKATAGAYGSTAFNIANSSWFAAWTAALKGA